MRSLSGATAATACAAVMLAALFTGSPAALAGTPQTRLASSPAVCEGAGSVANNLFGAATGSVNPPIFNQVSPGTPYLDGDVVRADNSVSFMSWGSCMAEVAFQMETKVCGAFGCSWRTRNHGTWEYLWKHADEGSVAQQVTMGCRQGTNTYKVHMAVVGPASIGEEPKGKQGEETGGAIGVDGTASAGMSEDGPEVKLTC
jgi:hypothetical protein